MGKARDSKAQDRLVAIVLFYLPLGQLLREQDRDGLSNVPALERLKKGRWKSLVSAAYHEP